MERVRRALLAVVLASVGLMACTPGSTGGTNPPPPTTTPPPPAPGEFPTPDTVGWRPTGVTLSPYTGPCVITTDGTVIDAKDVTCTTLEVQADDVHITRSRIRASGDFAVRFSSGERLLIADSEITSTTAGAADRAIALWSPDATVRSSYVHSTRRGIALGDGARIVGNYVDDLVNPSDAHTTAVSTSGGTHHVVVSGNTLGCNTQGCSSAISIYPENWAGGPNDDIRIEDNLLNGGSYCVYLGYSPDAGELPNTNMVVVDNVFGDKYYPDCGRYGPAASWTPPPVGTGNVFSGNVDARGAPVQP